MEEKEVGSEQGARVEPWPGPIIQARCVLGAVCTLLCLSLLAGCAAGPVLQRTFPDPPPRLAPALFAFLGDEPGLTVSTVDGVPWQRLADVSVLRDPNVPIGKYRDLGVWLAPGLHVVHAKYFRNIVGGVTFVQGDLRVNARSGHTYMIRPSFASENGKVSFTVIDYGMAFPQACLPGAISNAKQLGQGIRYERFAHDEIVRCLQSRREH